MKATKIFAIIPAHNEFKNIGKVIRGAKKHVKNVVVVDDGSKDETPRIAKENGAILLRHIINLGKGAALKTGCDFAIKQRADDIIVLDADGQHDPAEIPNFINRLKDADIVFGCRKKRKDMPFIFKFGNWFITQATKFVCGIDLKDTQCGYRAFSSAAYKKIRWNASDYSMESEMIARAGKHKLKYKEVPIATIYSDKYKGTTVLDGIKIVVNMLWWKVLNNRG